MVGAGKCMDSSCFSVRSSASLVMSSKRVPAPVPTTKAIDAFFQPRAKKKKSSDLNEASSSVIDIVHSDQNLIAPSESEERAVLLLESPVTSSSTGDVPEDALLWDDDTSDGASSDSGGEFERESSVVNITPVSRPSEAGYENDGPEQKIVSGPLDIAQSKHEHPTQPFLKCYPSKKFQSNWRHFHSEWFSLFPWLEYSVTKDAAFCFPCRLFCTSSSSNNIGGSSVFTHTGFSNWKRALEKGSGLKLHDNSSTHKHCVVLWESYKQMKSKGPDNSVLSEVSAAHRELVLENRHYIATLAEVLLLTGIQKIAQRGHDESVESFNRGNFVEFLQVIAKHDPRLQKKIEVLPKNAKYTHPKIQNEIINVMANLVIENISREVNEAGCYALMADETKDISKTEQISIVVRYFLGGSIYERFLGYHPCASLDAASLHKYIITVLAKCGIDKNRCIAQTYDGASVMSGRAKGVQALFSQEVPQSIYVHCFNHRLNLVIVDVCKANAAVSRFLAQMERLYVFVSRSTVHPKFVALQKQVGSARVIELKRLSETRWVCQISSCIAVKATISVIILLLHQISLESNTMKGNEARGILDQINFEFIFCLHLFSDVLQDLKLVSDYLQKSDSDLSQACILVEALITTFDQMRSQGKFDAIMSEVKTIAEEHNLVDESTLRRRKIPARFAQYATELQTSEDERPSSDTDYKIKVFFPVLDHVISELNQRFSDNSEILLGIGALNPKCEHFLSPARLRPLAQHYNCNMDGFEAELRLFPLVLQRIESTQEKIDTSDKLARMLSNHRVAFQELNRLAVIAVTIPPSSAGCERSFSSLRQIKTYLRNTMCHERLSDLAVLGIEKIVAKSLNMDEVVNRFAASHNNRRIQLA